MKRIIALSCFAALLLAGCGKTGQSSSSSESTTAATAPTSAETTTDEAATETAVTTAADTTAAGTEAETTTHEANVSAGGRMDMYPAVYQSEIRYVFEQTAKDNDGLSSIEYAFRDMDADGIPELILKYGTCEADYAIHVYRFDENCELQDLGAFGGGHTSFCYDENTGNFVILWGQMGYATLHYFVWQDGTLKVADTYDFELNEQNPSYDDVLKEKGIHRIDFVSAYQTDNSSGVKSWFYHENGTTEEFDGLYLDYTG